jgi:hypothetical protein
MSKPSHDPSIEHEFDSTGGTSPDPACDEPALKGAVRGFRGEESAEHNVWDEPAYRASGKAPPSGARTYDRWYRDGLEEHSELRCWFETLVLSLSGGFFALIGLLYGGGGVLGVLLTFGVAPVAEEVFKVSVVVIVLEIRPYLFRTPWQILIAVLSSAFIFALVDVGLRLPGALHAQAYLSLALFGVVNVGLHLASTAVAGAGLVTVWSSCQPRRAGDAAGSDTGAGEYTKPELAHAFNFLMGAIVLRVCFKFAIMPLEALLFIDQLTGGV